MKKVVMIGIIIAVVIVSGAVSVAPSAQARNGHYKVFDGIVFYEPIDVTIETAGTKGNTVTLSAFVDVEQQDTASVYRTPGKPNVGSINFNWYMIVTKDGVVRGSFELLLEYENIGHGANPIEINLECWWGHIDTIRMTLNAKDGEYQSYVIDLDETLTDYFDEIFDVEEIAGSLGTLEIASGTRLEMAPGDEPPTQETTVYWESFYWDFGDGTTLFTTEERVTHVYENPGTYTLSLTVTWEDGYQETETLVVVVT